MSGLLDRQQQELREHRMFCAAAAFSDESLGRMRAEPPDRYRTSFQCDRDRILHCKSFRRLANKTQVFLAPEGDHFRTRLTHTLEVAQISRDIARPLRLNEDLAEAIALGHDIGHTPFGHAGERALQAALKAYDQAHRLSGTNKAHHFSHEEQGVRVVEVLERDGAGLNLTLEVTNGMRCHRGDVAAITLEGRIVSRADRIAYVCHDIDDAERAGLLSEEDLPAEECRILGHSSSERIQTMVEDVISNSFRTGDILMSGEVWNALMNLRSFLFEHLYKHGDAKTEEPKAEELVRQLFSFFIDHMDYVPEEYLRLEDDPAIAVTDYVSSMSDRFAIRLYQDLFVPRSWGMD